MPLTTDLVESWRRPRKVVRRHLDRGRSEPFAFSLLAVFLILAFIAQWPVAQRAAFEDGNSPLAPRLLAIALALLATIPLWYGLAALSRVIARAFGGRGTWYGTRIALFWSLVAVTPVMLLQGMVAGMIGPSPGLTVVQVFAGLAFVVFWGLALVEVER
ncbi:MAG: YIP1 family protein [Rhodobacteraceae bacterium]|nr:YIP1 family protein [Paracoccaceae bacterium]